VGEVIAHEDGQARLQFAGHVQGLYSPDEITWQHVGAQTEGKWQTEGSELHLADRDYPELADILTKPAPAVVQEGNEWGRTASKTAKYSCDNPNCKDTGPLNPEPGGGNMIGRCPSCNSRCWAGSSSSGGRPIKASKTAADEVDVFGHPFSRDEAQKLLQFLDGQGKKVDFAPMQDLFEQSGVRTADGWGMTYGEDWQDATRSRGGGSGSAFRDELRSKLSSKKTAGAAGWYVIQRGTMTQAGGPFESQEEAEGNAALWNEKYGVNDYLATELGGTEASLTTVAYGTDDTAITPLVEQLRAFVKDLAEVSGIDYTFGYIGNLDARFGDDRIWYVFAPHPGRVGTDKDRFGGVRTEQLAELIPLVRQKITQAKTSSRTASLNDKMDFDHVVQVLPGGQVVDAHGVYAPELYDDELQGAGWTLMDGYSGQSGYSGPIMHASEYIGGGLERDILANPGYYVTLVNNSYDDEEPEGWAIAYKAASKTSSKTATRHLTLTGPHAGQPICGAPMDSADQNVHAAYAPEAMLSDPATCAACRAAWIGEDDPTKAPDTNQGQLFASRKLAWEIEDVRSSVDQGWYGQSGVDGTKIDQFSASALTQVYDALNAENQAKLRAMPIERAVDVAFKLIKKHQGSVTAGDSDRVRGTNNDSFWESVGYGQTDAERERNGIGVSEHTDDICPGSGKVQNSGGRCEVCDKPVGGWETKDGMVRKWHSASKTADGPGYTETVYDPFNAFTPKAGECPTCFGEGAFSELNPDGKGFGEEKTCPDCGGTGKA
jgi:hypothetical protein